MTTMLRKQVFRIVGVALTDWIRKVPVTKKTKFADVITQVASDGKLYMAGNINEININNMVGLDCSGFACSVYDLTSKTNTAGFINYHYGHEVSEGDLQPMDLLVLAYSHCYLYVNRDGSNYQVYDCTRGKSIDKTSLRWIGTTEYEGYTRLRLCYTYDPDASVTHHTYSCTECNISVTEEHSIICERYTTTQHTKYCTVCGYTFRETHVYTYVSDSEAMHTKTCTDCGREVTQNHTLTYKYNRSGHWQVCLVCNDYTTETVLHTTDYEYTATQHWVVCADGCGYTGLASDHTYSVYGRCTVCGYIESTGTLDSEEPTETQDADFVVLCIEPKEEFGECLQR